ncbi:2-oxoglutarate oxidoreductase subunit KorA [compost metagenome]
MTETPVVVVDTQRGGPSTGLPTKQEQSDVFAMIYGTHGEIPKIVLAPSTIEECFYDAIEAFNLAEEYQCPVILLTDLQLSLGKQSSDIFDYKKISIRRGRLTDQLPELGESELFKRYAASPDGVSPRVVPGTKHGLHHVTGVEHDEAGRPSESPVNRKKMMDKRLAKLKSIHVNDAIKVHKGHAEPDMLIIGMGSTLGTIDEGRARLEDEGIKTAHITIRQLHPFPTEDLIPYINRARKVVVVENNATGQLASLLKLNVGQGEKIHSVLKYDGNPFLPAEIHKACKGLIVWQR